MFNLFKKVEKAPQKKFVEIGTRGFLPSSYMSFLVGKVEPQRCHTLEQGTRIVTFKNGDMIIESTDGHLLVLNDDLQVTFLRLEEKHIDTDLQCCMDRGSLVRVKQEGETTITCAPGDLTIKNGPEGFSVAAANKVIFTAFARVA